MHNTKLLLVAVLLLSLGWAQLGWSADITESLRELTYKFPDMLQQEYESARTSRYSLFVQQNIAVVGGVYALIALFLLRIPDYRDSGWRRFRIGCFTLLALVGWFVVGYWIAVTCQEINQTHGGHDLIRIVTGIIWPLTMIALILTLWVGVPLYVLFLLFTLPSILFVIVPFLVRLPFLAYQLLHYLTVPHPAERIFRKHEKVSIKRGVKVDHVAMGEELGGAMYNMEREGVPAWWKSENWKRRLEKLRERLKVERDIVDDATDRARERNRTRR